MAASQRQRRAASTDEWHSSTLSNITHADGAHKQAIDHMMSGMLSVRMANSEHGRQRDTVAAQFQQKISNTQELSQQLTSRIHANKVAWDHTQWSLQKLKTGLEALSDPTEVNRQRLQLRQKRPKREMVHDAFQEALLREEKELQVCRSRIVEAINETQRVARLLETSSKELETDLRDKQHALSLDVLCVDKKTAEQLAPGRLDKLYSRKGTPAKAVLPEIGFERSTSGVPSVISGGFPVTPRTPRPERPMSGIPESQGREQERNRQLATLRCVEAAGRVELNAKARWQESSELLEHVAKVVAMMAKATQVEMGAKVEHTEVLKLELIKQCKVTARKVEQVQKTLEIASGKLRCLDTPMSASQQRSKIRGQRNQREATEDEVTEALHVQQSALQAQKQQLESQTHSMKLSLEELQAAHTQLAQDIQDKEKALAVDRACAAVKNAAHGSHSFGFSRVGTGQRHCADTASSTLRLAEKEKERQSARPVSARTQS